MLHGLVLPLMIKAWKMHNAWSTREIEVCQIQKKSYHDMIDCMQLKAQAMEKLYGFDYVMNKP